MSECQQAEAKLADFISGYADADASSRVRAHLDTCPACRHAAEKQQATRQQLRLLAQKDAGAMPPAHLWKRATAAWDAQDGHRRRGGQLRWAAAGACMLVFLMGTVWARLTVDREFPVEAAIQDFDGVRHALPQSALVTSDADRAARWLRLRLHSDLPPINLSLSRADLLGVDVVATPQGEAGRLLYRSPQGLMALYVVPGRAHFTRTMPLMIENQDFQTRSKGGITLYGWEADGAGYGLVDLQPAGMARGLVINAEHASDQPVPAE